MKDRITVGAVHMSPFLNFDDPEAVHPVEASHLKPYLEQLYGPDVPADRHVRWLTDDVFVNLSNLSTDETTIIDDERDMNQYFSHFLRLVVPFVDSVKSLGRNVDEQLSRHEDGTATNRAEHEDLTYSFGLYDICCDVISGQLSIPRARQLEHPTLAQRLYDTVAPSETPHDNDVGHESHMFQLLLSTDLIKAEHRRRLLQVQTVGGKLILASTQKVDRLRNVIPGFIFDDL